MIVVTLMLPIISIISMISIILMYPFISMQRRNLSVFAIPVIPSVFWAIVRVFTAVIDIVAAEHAPWILRDLVPYRRMVSQEISYFFVLIEIVAVVDKPGIGL